MILKSSHMVLAVPFIKLGVVDLSRYVDGPEGVQSRKALAADLEEACVKPVLLFVSRS